ncbi:MAG: DUF1778 domain-containing protein, partial [Rhodobacteraceae bacterium]|nr:DUF1778 domain-containing protein [Paracoccaceae bacterium]
MLDLPTDDVCTKKHTRTTQIRHGEDLGELIMCAAAVLGVDKSVFLRAAIAKESSRVLKESSHHVWSPEDADQFAAGLDAALKEAP